MLREDNITIPRYVYDQLVQAQNKLSALGAAGVDNWEGYDYAMEILQEIEDEG